MLLIKSSQVNVLSVTEEKKHIRKWEKVDYLRNKSWKPECVGSFNMDWRILVFYPEPEARDKIY